MIRPKLRQFEYLTALEDENSFSNAASFCNVTQSTLSAGIKELEDTLGQKLVNRTGRKITLTPLGTEVAKRARDVLIDVDKIVACAQEQQKPLNGSLRLGLIPTIAPYLLPTILPYMTSKFPNLELQLFEDISERIITSLHKRQIDAAIIAFPYATEGMEEHLLFSEDFYLAVPANRVPPKNLSIKDIKPEELLLIEEGHCLRDHALSACKLQLPARRKTFSATSLATLIQMVDHGFGITLLPEMVVKNSTMPNGVKLLPFTQKEKPSRQIGMVWLKNTPIRRDLETLNNAFREFLA